MDASTTSTPSEQPPPVASPSGCARARLGTAPLVGLAGPSSAAVPRAHAQEAGDAPPAAVVQAFAAAWNRHAPSALLATLAADVVVRQRGAAMSRGSYIEVADVLGRRGVLTDADRLAVGRAILWASDWREVLTWAAELFEDDHQLDVDGFESVGDAVRFAYRARVNPFQHVAGLERSPAVEATVRNGKITALAIEAGRGAAEARDAAVATAQRADRTRAATRRDALRAGDQAPAQPAPEEPRPLPAAADTTSRGVSTPMSAAALGVVGLSVAALFATRTRARRSQRRAGA